ncbi:MAG: hypothetical protein ACQETH_03765 [Candidatus Rifleibacteriota bacterium]
MKVEIKMNEKEEKLQSDHNEPEMHAPSCDVAIDIGQVLAANQALLKNMAFKMEKLENKLGNLERAYAEQSRLLEEKNQNTCLLIEGPAKEFKPWEPEKRPLNEDYYRKFSIIDKVFRPWIMRRDEFNN